MENFYNVYIEKGCHLSDYEIYSFKVLDSATTLRYCASKFGLIAFVVSVGVGRLYDYFTKRCRFCNPFQLVHHEHQNSKEGALQ